MNYDDFVGQVQNRARLASEGEAVRAIRATLETLAARLAGGEAKDLASQLPREIGYYLVNASALAPHRLSLDEFFHQVQAREGAGVHLPAAIHHARVVIEMVKEAVSAGEIRDVLAQLPPEWRKLFEAGSEGNLELGKLAEKR